MKIAINGAGRIGRCLIRKIILDKNLQLTHINDTYLTHESLCYLLNYDSIYGSLTNKKTIFKNKKIYIGKNEIIFSNIKIFTRIIFQKFRYYNRFIWN